MFEFPPAALTAHRDDVEAHRGRACAMAGGKDGGSPPKTPLLALVDCGKRRPGAHRPPRFHLDEDERIAVKGDKVDFRAGGPKIARHDPVPAPPKMPLRQPLASSPERMRPVVLLDAEPGAKPVFKPLPKAAHQAQKPMPFIAS